jgi:hypothetical protein
MAGNETKIPYKISEYLHGHFREGFLFEVKKVTDAKGRVFYNVEVDQDNLTYQLKFTEEGNLLKEEADPAFPQDPFEDLPHEEGYHPEDF